MNTPSNDRYLEFRVPDTLNEQTFLRLAVQAAVKAYRKNHPCLPSWPVRRQRLTPLDISLSEAEGGGRRFP